MNQRSRSYLRDAFSDGKTPEGIDFADIFESFINLVEDPIKIDGNNNVNLSTALKVGTTTALETGTIRFEGGQFEFREGSEWRRLGDATGGAFEDLGGGNGAVYDGGNVGIGTSGDPASHKLTVNLRNNAGPEEQVRFGNAVFHDATTGTPNRVYLSHANLLAPDPTSANVYTMRIFDDGRVDFNAPTTESIRFYQGGTQARMAIQPTTGNVVVGSATSANIGGVRFYVAGNAAKTSGGNVWVVGSDMRLKKDVSAYEDGLEMLKKINPIKFKYNGKAGTVDGEENIGLSGQEIEHVAPYMVSKAQVKMNEEDTEDSEVLMLDSGPLMYMAVNAIKELSARVEALEQQLAAQ